MFEGGKTPGQPGVFLFFAPCAPIGMSSGFSFHSEESLQPAVRDGRWMRSNRVSFPPELRSKCGLYLRPTRGCGRPISCLSDSYLAVSITGSHWKSFEFPATHQRSTLKSVGFHENHISFITRNRCGAAAQPDRDGVRFFQQKQIGRIVRESSSTPRKKRSRFE